MERERERKRERERENSRTEESEGGEMAPLALFDHVLLHFSL